MPNLVGIWSPKLGLDEVQNTLARQLNRVHVPSGAPTRTYSHATSGFGMALADTGILENGAQPARLEGGRYSLILDGELYNASELKKRFLRDLPDQPIATPELMLRLVERHGAHVANLFNGVFVALIYDEQNRRLTVINDRAGFRPLYYVARDGAFLFGTEIKAIAIADPTRPKHDAIGVAELFSYGTHAFEKTWIDGYVRLPPASILTIDASGVRLEKYWAYKYDETAPTLDQPTYFTNFAKLLDRAVERSMQGRHRIGIFLSGGYDSRALAASIRSQHLPIPAFTFGYPESRDVRYAALLAERLNLEHHSVTERAPHLYQYCRSIVWRSEGMSSFNRLTSIRFHQRIKAQMDICLAGFLHEFSGSHTWPALLLARGRKPAIDAIYDRMLAPGLERTRRIFTDKFHASTIQDVKDRFFTSFERIPHEDPMNIADAWNNSFLQPRSTMHSPSIDRHQFELRVPHMDHELVDFLLSIPPRSRIEQRVYKQMIAYAYPKIRDVPCTNSGKPIDPEFFREYTKMAANWIYRQGREKVSKVIPMKPSLFRNPRDTAQELRDEPELIDKILNPLLEANILSNEIFDHAKVRDLVKDHYERGQDHEGVLSLLISFGEATKYFMHGDVTDVPSEMWQPSATPSGHAALGAQTLLSGGVG